MDKSEIGPLIIGVLVSLWMGSAFVIVTLAHLCGWHL